MKKKETYKVEKPVEEWKKELDPLAYKVLREQGTERAFTGEYDHFFEEGVYQCKGCGYELFTSDAKYNSGCGWPAFHSEKEDAKIEEIIDKSHGMVRTEVRCPNCGGHLGHLFPDGPQPTGMRYCINSASLDFKKEE